MRQHQFQQDPAKLVVVQEHVVRPFQPETAYALSAGGAVRAGDVRGTVLRAVRRIRRRARHVRRCVRARRPHLCADIVDGLHRGQSGDHLQPAVDAGVGHQRLRQHRGERHHRRLPRQAHPLPSEPAMAGGLAIGHDHGDGWRIVGIRNPVAKHSRSAGARRGDLGPCNIRTRGINRRPCPGQQPAGHRIRRIHLVEPQHPVGGAAGTRQTPHCLNIVPVHGSTLSPLPSAPRAHVEAGRRRSGRHRRRFDPRGTRRSFCEGTAAHCTIAIHDRAFQCGYDACRRRPTPCIHSWERSHRYCRRTARRA